MVTAEKREGLGSGKDREGEGRKVDR